MKKLIKIIKFLLLASTIIFADSSEERKIIMPFLLTGAHARASGIGDANVSLAEGAALFYYNPAGISKGVEEITFSRANLYQEISQNSISGIFSLKNKTFAGFCVDYLDFGQEDKRDDIGKLVGTFRNYAFVLNNAYGGELAPNLSLGLNIKFANQNIVGNSYNSLLFDTGMIYKFSENISLGYTLQNVGINFNGYALPTNLRVGLLTSTYLESIIVRICTDIVLLRNTLPRFANGIEFELDRRGFVRIGFNNQNDIEQTLSLGVGYWGEWYKIDIAFIPSSIMEHKFIITFGLMGSNMMIKFPKVTKGGIEVNVYDKKGNRIKGALVVVYKVEKSDTKSGEKKELIKTYETNQLGSCLITGLQEGEYVVKTWAQNYKTIEKKVILSSGEKIKLDLYLDK
ncbi:MAG: PorV/PorQ family protein [Endomicrobiia bacterium]